MFYVAYDIQRTGHLLYLTGESDGPECQIQLDYLHLEHGNAYKVDWCMNVVLQYEDHDNRHSGFLYGTFYSAHRNHRHILRHQSDHRHDRWAPAYQATKAVQLLAGSGREKNHLHDALDEQNHGGHDTSHMTLSEQHYCY